MKETQKDGAVSPVVGVMLMLVVVIIIAAIVSAFAGGAVSGQKKVPQATITGKFSVSNGLEITHAGGDALAANDISFTIRDNSVFGPNLEQTTAQVLDKKNITNGNGKYMLYSDGSMDFTSFVSGDTLYISADNTTCNIFQPGIAPGSGISGATYDGTKSKYALWALCIRNPDNVGKTFSLEVSDKKGNLISKSDVTIST
jgi:FlaG/FlaF family flagellin (archaellin)